jgi:uncharacterized protein YegL
VWNVLKKMASVQISFELSSYSPGETVHGVASIKANEQIVEPIAEPIAGGIAKQLSPEIVIVIDVSGSMIPVLPVVQAVCEFALARFVDKASCAVVSFADHAQVLQPMTALSADVALLYTDCLRGLTAGGQTNLGEALSTAYNLFSADARKSVLMVTDGVPTSGPVSIADMIVHQGLPLYTVAIGTQCDNALLAQLAHRSGGMFADAAQLDGVVSATGGLFGAIFGTVLSDVTLCMNADSLSMLPSNKTAFATTVNVGPVFTSEEVHIPFLVGPSSRYVTVQLYGAGKLLCTEDVAVPFNDEPPVVNHVVRSQLLRADVARLLHSEPLDTEMASVLMAKCVEDRSDVGLWLTKRLVAALESSSQKLPSLRQELVRARSTAYDNEHDWLVPACMRTFSQEAQEFAGGHPTSFDDIDAPGIPPLLCRQQTWAGN